MLTHCGFTDRHPFAPTRRFAETVRLRASAFVLCSAAACAVFCVAGCDRIAGAQNSPAASTPPPAAPAAPRREPQPFVEGETCTRTEDCPGVARCFDGRCQLSERALAGEVHAERGARALARGRYNEAGDAFRAAAEAYRARSLGVPASVSCGLARALVAINDRVTAQDGRETTARALRECLAAAPPNSTLADQAVAGLAALSERGLDLAALDRAGATLMTGRDPRPTAENTRVRLTFTGQGPGSRQTFRDLINGEAMAREVTRCFLQWWETSHQNEDEGTLRVSFQRSVNDYDELQAPRLQISAVEIVPTAADAGTQLHWLQCTAQAIQNAVSAVRWPANADRWAESIVVSVRPG